MSGDNKTIYYLVSPGDDHGKKPRPYYWMIDIGDKWIGIARGIYRAKLETDIVKEVAEAEHMTRLDWSKTPFHNDNLTTGWLSRDGVFYGCPSVHHDTLAFCVLGMKVSEMEKAGWVRVHASWFDCEQRLSAEQRNWLSMNGFKVHDSQ